MVSVDWVIPHVHRFEKYKLEGDYFRCNWKKVILHAEASIVQRGKNSIEFSMKMLF